MGRLVYPRGAGRQGAPHGLPGPPVANPYLQLPEGRQFLDRPRRSRLYWVAIRDVPIRRVSSLGSCRMAEPAPDAARRLAQARAGSREALGQALEACRRYLLRIAEDDLDPALRAKGGASDLVQQTFLE